MLASLYGHSLLQNDATTVPENEGIKFLGKNGKKVLVMVMHASVPILPDEELSFLTNILSACKLGLSDIAIVNCHQVHVEALQQLIAEEGKKVLMFGLEPLAIGLPINFPQFQLQPFDGRTYLYGPALSELQNDKNLKMKLWTSLKNLFGI
jgi:hypothetical protein